MTADDQTDVPRRGSAVAIAIEGFFAAAWFSWGASDHPPSWLAASARVLAGVAGVVGIAGVVLAVRSRADRDTGPTGMRSRGYRIITAAEAIAIVVGSAVLGGRGHSEYIAAWAGFVVGVHFFPLANVFGRTSLRVLGALICLVAIVAVAVGLETGVSATTVAGTGIGMLLLGSATGLLAVLRRRPATHVSRVA